MPSSTELGVLETADGFRYQITPDDALWLARATQFEGRDHAATIWAFASRFAGLQRSGSLASFVRSYSQPVNPLWDELSDEKCIERPEYCTPDMMARREQARTTSWEGLRSDVRAAVLAFAQAALPNPLPRVTDFASYNVASWLARQPGARILKHESGGNFYSTVERSNGWPAGFVRVRYGSRVASDGASSGLSFFGALLLGAGLAAVGGGIVWAVRRFA